MSYNSNSVDRYTPDSRLERLKAEVRCFGIELRDLNSRVAYMEAREKAELDRLTRRRENINRWFQIFASAFVGMIFGLAITH
jgi:hypothetical protein